MSFDMSKKYKEYQKASRDMRDENSARTPSMPKNVKTVSKKGEPDEYVPSKGKALKRAAKETPKEKAHRFKMAAHDQRMGEARYRDN